MKRDFCKIFDTFNFGSHFSLEVSQELIRLHPKESLLNSNYVVDGDLQTLLFIVFVLEVCHKSAEIGMLKTGKQRHRLEGVDLVLSNLI